MDQLIRHAIRQFTAAYPHSESTGWQEPLIAYARAADPLFLDLKALVSPTHALPFDFLKTAKTVITYFIPFRDQVVESNKKGRYSSATWAISYLETNRLIAALNQHLQSLLAEQGYEAAHVPATHNFDQKTLQSDWSHRSAAYIAGLGTFGVNQMLITEAGCCGRIGSLITNLELEATLRPTTDYCLLKTDGSCGRCVKKCVNRALSTVKLDKQLCYKMCLTNAGRLSDLESIADVCGKCLVGVPCSSAIPAVNG